jgi:hypothetical protein
MTENPYRLARDIRGIAKRFNSVTRAAFSAESFRRHFDLGAPAVILRISLPITDVRSRRVSCCAADNTAKEQRGRTFRPDQRATRKRATEAWPPSANQSRKICQSQKFILRHNGVFRPCEIGKLIDSEGFSLFPRERQ